MGLASLLVVLWAFIDVGARVFDDPSDGRDTVLRVLYWGDPEEEKIVIQTIEAFEAANPNVKVQRIHAGFGTFNQKLKTMMAAGEPPDVFYLSTENLRLLGEMELVEPLDEYLQQDPVPWFDDFYPVLVDTFTFDANAGVVGEGDLLGLPKDFTTSGMYVNVDLFKRAGVEVPYDGWTWDEMADAAEKITALRDDENDRIFGVHFNQWPDMIAVQSWNFGGDLFEQNPDGTYDFTQTALGEDGALELAEFMRRLRFEERTAFVAAGIARDAGAEFLSGNIGIVGPAGRWMTPQYRPITDFEWDFVPVPTKPGVEPANGIFTVAWAMSSQSEHKEESWELLKFLAGPQGQTMIGELGLAIPAMENIANSEAFLVPGSLPKNTQLFLDLVESGRPIEYPTQTEVKQFIESEFAATTNLNTRTPQEAAENVQRQWSGLLQSPLQTEQFNGVAWTPILAFFAFLVLLGSGFLFLKAKREKLGQLDAAQERAGFAFISPWLIGFALLTAGPMVLSLILAFTKWSAMTPVADADYVGSANFVQLVKYDETFFQSIWVTIYYVVLAVPITQVAALAVALLMNAAVRGIEVFRTIYFLPSVITGVAMGTLWLALFNDDFGLINEVIRSVGLP
ncbi:MAG: extracellular solute-binding protein, partial [Planctomycetota bacterium]